MPECGTPLWPCAMTGAAACLAGFEGNTVVIHGSSGCYYYPATLLHAPLHGTFILENEVIFGSGDRLREVIGDLSGRGGRIAVITTCVPSVLGEDIKSMVDEKDIIVVDSPGFSGEIEAGYRAALAVLSPETTRNDRVSISTVSLFRILFTRETYRRSPGCCTVPASPWERCSAGTGPGWRDMQRR